MFQSFKEFLFQFQFTVCVNICVLSMPSLLLWVYVSLCIDRLVDSFVTICLSKNLIKYERKELHLQLKYNKY
jgi:hypothetical protein